MSLPVSTTTITVKRTALAADRDPRDPAPEPSTVASGVPAVIGSPAGSEMTDGGQRSNVFSELRCDPTDIDPSTDTVVDDATGQTYDVVWATQREGLGLDHTRAQLRATSGVV
jgi:hypothetical protein